MSTAQASAEHRSLPPTLQWRHLATSALWTALVLFALLALLLATRRLTGAIAEPLAGPILILFAAGAAAGCVLVRLWLLPLRPGLLARRSARDWFVLTVPSVALAVLLAAIITPGTSRLAAPFALLFAGAIEALFWRHVAVALRPRESSPAPQLLPADVAEVSDEESYPADLLQQIVRTREGTGEAIHAVLRAEFQPREQLQVLHVAFCPPLLHVPVLEAFVASESEASVRVTNVYTFGARLEVQLPSPAAEPASVLIEVSGKSQQL